MKCHEEALIYSFCKYLLSTYWCRGLTWALGHPVGQRKRCPKMCVGVSRLLLSLQGPGGVGVLCWKEPGVPYFTGEDLGAT